MRVRKVFTEKEEDIIIQFYSQNRFLWNQNDANYKIAVKSASLQDLVKQLNNKFTGNLQKSITDLVACKPLTNTTCLKLRNPQAADDIYVPTWPHFNSLTFLDDSAPNRSYKIKQEIVVEECLEILRSVKEGSSSSASSDAPKDSCECYGEYVTACLKAMSQWNQALAMADISNILIKYHPNNPNL
ncbi:hypothetical protein Bhyg_16343 [Pseudolycoriella hygida]|uniref:MADF domain-containing protein n=1 Tax=Pseudolycoriella hygida TaxID=35572 RepID=A0A9Q0MIJ0_9DIPT|nr:hypothetical protein Bhyg_16437 [Pseudolycoriella hygida]KAJ6631747.1 hypothetical protein Bhyg_16343 [Pseudolycoriella hygida]